MEARLTIRGLSLSFGNLPVLDGLSMRIADGEIIALLGPSGCGKTTLLNVIAGLKSVTSGEVSLLGQQMVPLLGRSAYMHQEDRLLPWRTVSQNALLASEFEQGAGRRAVARNRALELLDELDLSPFAGYFPMALSGGMSRRVALARTLSVERDVYLLDEPLAGLDYQLRLRVEAVIFKSLSEHKGAALMVTHDIESALALADRIFVLSPRPSSLLAVIDCALARASGSPLAARESPEFHAIFHRALELVRSWDHELTA